MLEGTSDRQHLRMGRAAFRALQSLFNDAADEAEIDHEMQALWPMYHYYREGDNSERQQAIMKLGRRINKFLKDEVED